MKVLVAFASKYGSTRGIAEFIRDKLRDGGLEVDCLDVRESLNCMKYDAFVIGSALYMGHWMKEAKQFIKLNLGILSSRPVWLFSSGPTGDKQVNAKGQSLLEHAVSGPVDLDNIERGINAREHRIFFGAFDPENLGYFSRKFFETDMMRNASPAGDYRNWKEIETWANGIGQRLKDEALAPVMR